MLHYQLGADRNARIKIDDVAIDQAESKHRLVSGLRPRT